MPPRSFDAHARRAHGVYQWGGVRGSREEVVAHMLEALVTPRPDAEVWEQLADLAVDEYGARANAFLVEQLGPALARQGEKAEKVAEALADVLADSPGVVMLTGALAAHGEGPARHLALALCARLPSAGSSPEVLQALRSLLLDRRLSGTAQQRALAAVLKQVDGDEVLAAELLEKFVGGLGNARAVTRLKELEQEVGKRPALEDLQARLEANVRMTCPRCGKEMRRPLMVEHLWQEHRLVLDGLRAREPWSAIERWVDACRRRPDPERLQRCRDLAGQLEGAGGLARLHRLLLARGIADAATQRALLAEAAQLHAARCPWCYALVPVPPSRPPLRVGLSGGQLMAGTYQLTLDEHGLHPTLSVKVGDEILFQEPEPGRRWTRQGRVLLLAGPLVLLALAFSLLARAPVLPVLGSLLSALGVGVLADRSAADRERRLRRYAWDVLVPALAQRGFVPEDSALLAGLARSALAVGELPRLEQLREAVGGVEELVTAGKSPPAHLAALRRLHVESAVAGGADPVPLVVEQLARCFEGRLPLAYAQALLEGWEGALWTEGARARLRVLLCERAFEAGFEVGNLLDACHNAPALADLLGCAKPAWLAGLRLLWSQRPSRPWDRLGEAQLAFDLAADPERGALLARQPDLLLWQQRADLELAGGRAAEIALGAEGVYLQGVRFAEPPRVVEVQRRKGGWDLRLGASVFRSPDDMEELARQLERWFRYAFHEFLPALRQVQTWQSPDRSAILRAWGAVPCPECKRFLLPRVGQVGLALDEAEE